MKMLRILVPRMVSRRFVVVVAIALGFASQAHALGITGTDSYSHQLEASGLFEGQNGLFISERAITPFDPALGNLTDVELRIYGDITYNGFAAANWVEDAFGTPLFIPYTLHTEYELDIDGLFGDFFNLDTPLIVEKNFQTPGLPAYPIQDVASFDFTFDYDEAINLIFWGPEYTSCTGCDGFMPPLQMSGQPEGFIDDGSLVDQLDFKHRLSFMSLGAIRPGISSVEVTSDIKIQYTYRFTEFEPNPIPLPAGAWLFGTALLGMFGYNWRRKPTRAG